jgi:uncharacterized protein YbjT (DUF2867 family)
MNRILVIGGTGTVGRQVLSRLAATDTQEIDTARSVRQKLAIAGSQHVARSFSQRATSM